MSASIWDGVVVEPYLRTGVAVCAHMCRQQPRVARPARRPHSAATCPAAAAAPAHDLALLVHEELREIPDDGITEQAALLPPQKLPHGVGCTAWAGSGGTRW
jgi:hypothetical protein